MRLATKATLSDRPAGRRRLVFWLLASFAADWLRRRGQDQVRRRLGTSDRQADQAAGPENRPGRRPAQFHPGVRAYRDLCQAELLHREMDRRHRRQGQEGGRARQTLHARAGPGIRDEEGGRRTCQATHRSGEEPGRRGQGRRQRGDGPCLRDPVDDRQVAVRGRPLDHGGRAAQEGGRQGSRRPSDPPRIDQSVEVEHRCARRLAVDLHDGPGSTPLQEGCIRDLEGRHRGRPGPT